MYHCTMYSKELLKGTLSAIILNLLAENGQMYGYQITQKVKEISDNRILIKEGSLYPALHKLEAEGSIRVESVFVGKRERRYYQLTETGKQVKTRKLLEISNFMMTLDHVLFKSKTQTV